MSFRSVDAGRGVEWLKQAVELVLQNPVAFGVMALIYIVLLAIPVVHLITIFFVPALMAGIMWGAREQLEGRSAEIAHLFAPLQQPGKIVPLLLLCLPVIAALVVLLIVGFVLLGSSIIGAIMAMGSASASIAALGAGFALFALICFAAMVATWAAIFFAIPRVTFDGAEPIAAISESVSACVANVAPLLVLVGVVLGVHIVVGVVATILPFLATLLAFLVGVALAAVMPCATYLAYRDVFGLAGTDVATPPPPPG